MTKLAVIALPLSWHHKQVGLVIEVEVEFNKSARSKSFHHKLKEAYTSGFRNFSRSVKSISRSVFIHESSDCCLLMDNEAFSCCLSHKKSWSPTFLCRVVKSLNFVWVFSRPKQPEGEGKEKEGGHSEDAFQNSDENISTSYLRLII